MTNDNLLWKKKKKEKEKKKRQVLSQVQSSLLFLTYRKAQTIAHYPLTSWDMNIAWLLSSPLFHGLIEIW